MLELQITQTRHPKCRGRSGPTTRPAFAKSLKVFVCLFDMILYVHSTIFQLCGTGLPGLNQY